MFEPAVNGGMPILYDNPAEVGADRVVNAWLRFDQWGEGPPMIVVDFGTATTFDAISAKGEYLGGVICPGPQISADALFQRAARLPRIEVSKAGAGDRHEHGGVDAVRAVLGIRRHGGGARAAHEGRARRRGAGGRDRWPGVVVAPESSLIDHVDRGADAARPAAGLGTPQTVIDVDAYCRELEAYLCRKNDGHLIRITGPAFEHVMAWARQGIPLKVAEAGIDRYFERYYRGRAGGRCESTSAKPTCSTPSTTGGVRLASPRVVPDPAGGPDVEEPVQASSVHGVRSRRRSRRRWRG